MDVLLGVDTVLGEDALMDTSDLMDKDVEWLVKLYKATQQLVEDCERVFLTVKKLSTEDGNLPNRFIFTCLCPVGMTLSNQVDPSYPEQLFQLLFMLP